MDWSHARWVLDQKAQAREICNIVMTWINTVIPEMEFAIDTFVCFPHDYNAVEADRTNKMMTDFSRRIVNTNYGITVLRSKLLLGSGLGLSMSCTYYCSRQNLSLRIGDNLVWTRDTYECVAVFWSHWREMFTSVHEEDDTQPKI